MFPNDETTRKWFEATVWPDGSVPALPLLCSYYSVRIHDQDIFQFAFVHPAVTQMEMIWHWVERVNMVVENFGFTE